ncbi:MAG: DUF2029 domain-containing protein, partial [Actinobacteria bacterium]|nr:DUF2029 domain-containing protein [Actinomycetota bacterium]
MLLGRSRSRAAAGDRPRRAVPRDGWFLLVLAVGFAVRLGPLLAAGRLGGVLEYDDGVYYSASAAVLQGSWPYRDFVFVHPPGVALLLLPVTWLATVTSDTVALATARVLVCATGALTAALTYRYLRDRSRPAAVVAGLLYAVWRLPARAEHTILLEPVLALALVVALLLLDGARRAADGVPPGRRLRLLAASGAVMGLSLGVKVWAAAGCLVLLVHVLRSVRPRDGVTAWVVGLAAGAAVPYGFGLLAGTRAFVAQVVGLQVGREAPDSVAERVSRLADLAGLGGLDPVAGRLPDLWLGLGCLAVLAACCVRVARRHPAERHLVALGVLQVAMVLLAPASWYHYLAFAAPVLAVLVGLAVAGPPAA